MTNSTKLLRQIYTPFIGRTTSITVKYITCWIAKMKKKEWFWMYKPIKPIWVRFMWNWIKLISIVFYFLYISSNFNIQFYHMRMIFCCCCCYCFSNIWRFIYDNSFNSPFFLSRASFTRAWKLNTHKKIQTYTIHIVWRGTNILLFTLRR